MRDTGSSADATVTDRIEAALRREIAIGALSPSERLRVDRLKLRYDAGTSPIREALSRLLADGLVQLESNKGFRVSGLSREDLYDIAITRAGIEQAAVRRAMELGDDDWEASVIAALHRYRLASRRFHANSDEEAVHKWEVVHDDLHRAIVSACDAPRLLAFQERLLVQHGRYRRLGLPGVVDVDAYVREHEELVDAVLSRDEKRALRRIEEHMMLTFDVLEKHGFWKSC